MNPAVQCEKPTSVMKFYFQILNFVSLGSNCDKLIDHPRRVRAEKMNHVIKQTYPKKCQIRTQSIDRHLPFANRFLRF